MSLRCFEKLRSCHFGSTGGIFSYDKLLLCKLYVGRIELTRYCTKFGLVYPDSHSFLSGYIKMENKSGRHSLIINNPTELVMQLLSNSISHIFLKSILCNSPSPYMKETMAVYVVVQQKRKEFFNCFVQIALIYVEKISNLSGVGNTVPTHMSYTS